MDWPVNCRTDTKHFKSSGFELVWFDGDRPTALREFIKRATVREELFYHQMLRIENSKVIRQIKPRMVNTFDKRGKFNDPKAVLREIERTT